MEMNNGSSAHALNTAGHAKAMTSWQGHEVIGNATPDEALGSLIFDSRALAAPITDPGEHPPIRVLIVDDHEILAEGVRRLLDSCADINVVEVVGTLSHAVEASMRLHPDVVLMDYQLPDGDGVTAVARIKRESPNIQVVMLTGSGDDERLARRAFEVGCCGFLGKSRSVEDLLAVVRAAYAGEVLITPSMLLRLLPKVTHQYDGIGAGLSRRELEVLGVMAEGGTDKDIASRLFVSLNTARKHTQNIIRKLGAHSKLEAVVIAVREGVIRPL
jgi:DNA-binding NarL/FixJ family response regulator